MVAQSTETLKISKSCKLHFALVVNTSGIVSDRRNFDVEEPVVLWKNLETAAEKYPRTTPPVILGAIYILTPL